MKLNLGVKLFLSCLAVLLVGLLVLAMAAQFSLPGAYGRHLGQMAEMMSGSDTPGGMGPMHGQDFGAGQDLFANFQFSFYEAFAWAALAGLGAAAVVSLLISRRLTAPLRDMTVASQRMAEGRYSERVQAGGGDELGQLAASFNSMAEKLEQVEAMRRRLIGDVAHELRTPLTAIKGSMEGLVDGVLPASPETFAQVAAETERLNRLVDDLQELSRVESGAVALDLEPVSLPELVETARKRLAPSYASKGVSLTLDMPVALPSVRADTDRLLQVLTNLLGNALQYTPAGGHVTLSAETRVGEILVRVTDTGIGIPPEHLPHIFDRFYRVDKSRTRQAGGGSGIGLTISRALVEAHGGHLWAASPGKGRGSTFLFTLPLA
ncbi:MAG: ATP-binding protein [Chloroflexota bacterium]